MAAVRWLGRAGAVAQVDTVTMSGAGDWVTGDTITLTINGKDLVVTVGTLVTDAEVATTVKQAWENETLTDASASFIPADGGNSFPEHAEITATVASGVVTLTHDTAGVPFTLVVTESTAGDETATEATATAATGPNHWDNVDNWDTGSLPVSGDDVYIENSAVSILYALGIFFGTHDGSSGAAVLTDSTQNWVVNSLIGQTLRNDTDGSSTTVTANTATTVTGVLSGGTDNDWDAGDAYTMTDLASLNVARNYTGSIGLPKQNEGGYVEYRDDYLALGAAIIKIGQGEGSGSGRIKIDTGSNQTAIEVFNTGSPAEGIELEACLWKGTHASNTLEVKGGSVGVGVFGGETAVIATLLVNPRGRVRGGSGLSLTTITTAGALQIEDNVATLLTVAAGETTVRGSATVATLTATGGRVNYNSSGTIATLNLGGPTGAVFDVSGDQSSRTVSVCNLKANGTIVDPLRTITFTNGIAVGSDAEQLSAA